MERLKSMICPQCGGTVNRATDDICDECTAKLSNFSYDKNWL